MGGDVTIVINATGNLDAQVAQAVVRLQQARKAGQGVGEGAGEGIKGAIEHLHHFHREWMKFAAAGAAGYHVIGAATEGWAKAHEMAAERAKKQLEELGEQAKLVYEARRAGAADNWRFTNYDQNLRMAGVEDAGQRQDIAGKLQRNTGPAGEEIRRSFAGIAEVIGHQGLTSEKTGERLERVIDALNVFGHVQGYGDNLKELSGIKGTQDRKDIGELALGLTLREARLPAEIGKELVEALKSGAVSIDSTGGLIGKGAERNLAARINAMGGLLPRGASDGFNPDGPDMRGNFSDAPQSYRSINFIGGVVTAPNRGEAAAFSLPQQFKEEEKENKHPNGYGTAPTPDPEWKDYRHAAGDVLKNVFTEAAGVGIGLVIMKALQRAPKPPVIGAGGVGAGVAEVGEGAAAGAVVTGGRAAALRLAAATRYASVPVALAGAGVALAGMTGGGTFAPAVLDRYARDAIAHPEGRQGLIDQSLSYDSAATNDAKAILERMHEILMQQLEVNKQQLEAARQSSHDVAVPAQAGE